MSSRCIRVRGAREHNLKNINVDIPRDKLVVLTGLSGSGKSSLAFDTIYAEGQRRYVESLSAYARQFLGQMEKPDVDSIDGLSPAISIDQKTTSKNPRSTVGTVTEIYDYMRLLYARVGTPHCYKCGKTISKQTVDQMVDIIMALEEGTRIQLLAPVVRGRKGEFSRLLNDTAKNGYVRVRIDGEIRELSEDIKLEKNKKHSIEIVVDRLIVKKGMNRRLADSLETVLRLSGGIAQVWVDNGNEIMFNQDMACADCGISIEDPEPRLFSFNNPFGACPECAGLGNHLKVDPDLIIPDNTKSLAEGAIVVNGWNIQNEDAWSRMYFDALAGHYRFSLDTPLCELPEAIIDKILYGTKGEKIKIEYNREDSKGSFTSGFEGVITAIERRYRESQSDSVKQYYEQFMSQSICPVCHGHRLRPEALAVRIGGLNIKELCDMPVSDIRNFLSNVDFDERRRVISQQILKEIDARLGFLMDVGLYYLTLSRSSGTLSGGEAQRIRLATQIGSGLTGVLYILDEPSIGLHQRDNKKLLATMKKLRDLGNTLIVVEHDEETMYEADHIIDIGPGAGAHGGQIVAEGTVEDIKASKLSITGKYLSGSMKINIPKKRRRPEPGNWIKIYGARENNLKNINVEIPLGVFTCVTGVSGSGKSSLVNEILYKRLAHDLNKAHRKPGEHTAMEGLEALDKVINIDQSPLGRTPRSNPATYTGVFDFVREVFSSMTEAKMRGYKPGRFSFNVKGGRCEACKGDGVNKIEMHFLPDVYVPCDVCKGKRYNRETLEVKYRGRNIADVLDMTVEEALDFFKNIPSIKRKMQTLMDVGLGYIKVGQPSTTLSGGEAQRVKLAYELSRRGTGRTIYILDEPTTGLHTADVHKLVEMLQRLVSNGNTVVVIEHNLDVIKNADYIIDLGPEGGENGGFVVATGNPEEIAACTKSYTGQYLARYLTDCGFVQNAGNGGVGNEMQQM